MSALWLAVQGTVRSSYKQRHGLPNQDFVGVRPLTIFSRASDRLVVAVSDGHGSVKSFRSHIGAELAVKIAEQELWALVETLSSSAASQQDSAETRDFVINRLPERLVKAWRRKVDLHLKLAPFREEEFDRLEAQSGPLARKQVLANPRLPYGATLLVTALTPVLTVHMQLGDGEILEVSEEGVATRPLDPDPRLVANETTSLCGDTPWRDFRVALPKLEKSSALILLTTDGYPNSFRDDPGFLKVGQDLMEIIETEGLNSVERQLPEWLSEASRDGSGDDSTLALVCRMDIINRRSPEAGEGRDESRSVGCTT